MTDDERELQNPDTWDWDSLELHPGVKDPRMVLSVSFSGEEFQWLAACADQAGERLTDYVRQIVLERVYAAERNQTPAPR